jgi:CPA2 family monovalent cation:H+ antiporter-2
VRAGSELVLELLQQPPAERPPMAELDALLPGFGGLVTLELPPDAAAVGKSLAELDLRARSGATALAIARAGGGFASPTPTEPLRAGDVLALTGSDDALAAARLALTTGLTPAEDDGHGEAGALHVE